MFQNRYEFNGPLGKYGNCPDLHPVQSIAILFCFPASFQSWKRGLFRRSQLGSSNVSRLLLFHSALWKSGRRRNSHCTQLVGFSRALKTFRKSNFAKREEDKLGRIQSMPPKQELPWRRHTSKFLWQLQNYIFYTRETASHGELNSICTETIKEVLEHLLFTTRLSRLPALLSWLVCPSFDTSALRLCCYRDIMPQGVQSNLFDCISYHIKCSCWWWSATKKCNGAAAAS